MADKKTNELHKAAATAVKTISEAAAAATKAIAEAAASAARVVNNTAVEKAKTDGFSAMDDHNTLIRIETILNRVVADVAELKTNTVGRIDNLEINSISKTDHDKVVQDIVMLKNWKNWLIGCMVILMPIVAFLAVAIFNHLVK